MLEYLSDTYLLFSLPHTHAYYTHPFTCFLMYYLSCFVAHLFLVLTNYRAAPHFLSPCVCVCM